MMWYKGAKWVIILTIAYMVITYPSLIIGKLTEIMKPIVMEQVDIIMKDNKDSLTKGMQDIVNGFMEKASESSAPSKSNSTKPAPANTTTTKKQSAPL